nr:MAG TPA: DNA-directed RNA polymerase [Caudoviricetes sp.]DAS85092.1 MAG TPA: DNA-directed RNA polymerase [Caudoviricetes sp.]DAX19834.1 MAG TPA: DNA-directed RNA polymerase [Caudoviricetes sp.]DAX23221.1 MAG TPA: DNA-directed RNA polymerase [Caudoviricetes sp.]
MTREELKYREPQKVVCLHGPYPKPWYKCECPSCGNCLSDDDEFAFCPYCGQKLDWSVLDG